jgi:hypothetical protein
VIADLWNSPDFNPVAPPSDCHLDFHTATNCSYEEVAGLSPATPQRIEDIFTSMRSDLSANYQTVGAERARRRWTGRTPIEEERESEPRDDDATGADFGCLGGRPARALQTRAAFLYGRPSYLLYFWEVADNHQLLSSSLQCLSNGSGAADAASAVSVAPSSSSQRRKRREREDSEHDYNNSVAMRPFVHSMQEIAASQRKSTLDQAKDRRHERQLQNETQTFRRKAELLDLARSYRKLHAELNTSNERSARLSAFYVSEGKIIDDEIRQLEQQHQYQQRQESPQDAREHISFSDVSD